MWRWQDKSTHLANKTTFFYFTEIANFLFKLYVKKNMSVSNVLYINEVNVHTGVVNLWRNIRKSKHIESINFRVKVLVVFWNARAI